MGLTYAGSGVKYDAMDPFKVMAQKSGLATASNLNQHGFSEVAGIRGESSYLIEGPDCYWAHVEEGLGTKNLVADDMAKENKKTYYDAIAQDAVAMIVNDMITVGAQPLSVAMHLAVGSSDWFANTQRAKDLVAGWKRACNLSRCVWGGGETPTLRDIVKKEAAVISGSAVGIVKPKKRLIKGDVKAGDAIVFFASDGVNANGLTLARDVATRLPKHYQTKMSDGQSYGDALLVPTKIYVGPIMDALAAGIKIHYAINVTGHGWRKIMRLLDPFVYVIDKIPKIPEVFNFIQEQGKISDLEMWGNYNMGAGFAVIVDEADAPQVIESAKKNHIKAWQGGHLEKNGKSKQVIIKPKNIVFSAETMKIR